MKKMRLFATLVAVIAVTLVIELKHRQVQSQPQPELKLASAELSGSSNPSLQLSQKKPQKPELTPTSPQSHSITKKDESSIQGARAHPPYSSLNVEQVKFDFNQYVGPGKHLVPYGKDFVLTVEQQMTDMGLKNKLILNPADKNMRRISFSSLQVHYCPDLESVHIPVIIQVDQAGLTSNVLSADPRTPIPDELASKLQLCELLNGPSEAYYTVYIPPQLNAQVNVSRVPADAGSPAQ